MILFWLYVFLPSVVHVFEISSFISSISVCCCAMFITILLVVEDVFCIMSSCVSSECDLEPSFPFCNKFYLLAFFVYHILEICIAKHCRALMEYLITNYLISKKFQIPSQFVCHLLKNPLLCKLVSKFDVSVYDKVQVLARNFLRTLCFFEKCLLIYSTSYQQPFRVQQNYF